MCRTVVYPRCKGAGEPVAKRKPELLALSTLLTYSQLTSLKCQPSSQVYSRGLGEVVLTLTLGCSSRKKTAGTLERSNGLLDISTNQKSNNRVVLMCKHVAFFVFSFSRTDFVFEKLDIEQSKRPMHRWLSSRYEFKNYLKESFGKCMGNGFEKVDFELGDKRFKATRKSSGGFWS